MNPSTTARRVVALLLAVSLAGCKRATFRVPGGGMEPAIAIGQTIELDEGAYRRAQDVHRGDIVVVASPEDSSRSFVKRVIGLPGERVSVTDGRVSINGVALPVTPRPGDGTVEQAGSAKYTVLLSSHCSMPAVEVVLTPDAFFVLGDNRCASRDSRVFGTVSFSAIRGAVLLRK